MNRILWIGLLLALTGWAQTPYPDAVDPARVGKYPTLTKSGGGYFYDDVLEYRVWIEGGDGGDHFRAFATYSVALKFLKEHRSR